MNSRTGEEEAYNGTPPLFSRAGSLSRGRNEADAPEDLQDLMRLNELGSDKLINPLSKNVMLEWKLFLRIICMSRFDIIMIGTLCESIIE